MMFHAIRYARVKFRPISSYQTYRGLLTDASSSRKYAFPTSFLPRRAQNRGAKRKSTVTLDDLSTPLPEATPLDSLSIEDGNDKEIESQTNNLKGTTNVDNVEELPQGLIPLDPLPAEDTEPALPTVLLQARNNIRKFENCVLLTRVGGFYELYFEHADELGPLLNLKVAQRKTGKKDNLVYVSMVSEPKSSTMITNLSVGWVSLLSARPLSQDLSAGLKPLRCDCRGV